MPAFFNPLLLVAILIGLFTSPREASAQPAPALSQLYAYHVSSTGYPQGENVQGKMSTITDRHAGPNLYVRTYERGYGNWRSATFNGRSMRESSSSPHVINGRIVGWYRTWYHNGAFTSGTFTYQSRSTNSPWNLMSTRLTIR